MKYVLAIIGASFLAALPAGAIAKSCQLKGNVMTCGSGSYVVGGPMATDQDDSAPATAAGDPAATGSGKQQNSPQSPADNPVVPAGPDAAAQDPANPVAGANSGLSPDAMLKCIEKHPFAPCR